jgi:hypothetical protein
MEILDQELEIPTLPEVNQKVKVNGNKSGQINKETHNGVQWNLNRCRNFVAIVNRIPMEPISQRRRSGLFQKLMKLDQNIVSGSADFSLKKRHKQEFLLVIRHAINRFAKSVARTVIEVNYFKYRLIHRIIH